MSTPKNNHYISKFLLKPWEFKPGKLRVLDYSTGKIDDADTETLFAKHGIFTPKQEAFFNRIVENISSSELATIAKRGYQTNKWKSYRAVNLLLWDLVGRYAAAKTGDYRSVDFFTSLDDAGLDQYVSAILENFLPVFVSVPADCRLCFPSNMLLTIFHPESGECSFGIPVNCWQALFAVRKDADMSLVEPLAKTHYFGNLSAGSHATDFVVLPPDIPETPELVERILKQRERNEQQTRRIGDLRALTGKMYESVGISPQPIQRQD